MTAWRWAWSRRSRPPGSQDKVVVFGTDGISDAYASIRAGELTGTVDSFPVLTGEVAMEVALRLMGGQDLPRVVATPQALITKDNVETYRREGRRAAQGPAGAAPPTDAEPAPAARLRAGLLARTPGGV